MKDKKVRFITFGCRVNQYETQGMREALQGVGVSSAASRDKQHSSDVEFVVLNTCTVTFDADRENRYWIRRARREHPSAKIIVTGCGVERDREKIEAMPEVDLVLLNRDKASIADKLELGCARPDFEAQVINDRQAYTPLSISQSAGKTRAFIKIQDGCNHACSFCKVVLVRGRSRSRQLQDILDEVKRLRDSGYRDFVFAGIQLGAYGHDLREPTGLRVQDVLEACSQIEGVERLRLSSIEPTDVEDSLIDALKSIEKCSHHLHIPLQSGDDAILERMNRRYSRAFYIELIEKLKLAMPDFRLTSDVMAGFPGETEMQFQNTVRLLEQVKPLHCHIFPYSPREGTKAFRFGADEEVTPEVKKERVRRLMGLSEQLGREVRQGELGAIHPVLVENVKEANQKLAMGETHDKIVLHGLTANYMKVAFQGYLDQVGQIVPVELLSVQGDTILGTMAHQPSLVEK